MRAILLLLLLVGTAAWADGPWRAIGSPSLLGRDLQAREQADWQAALPALQLRAADATGWPLHETLRALRAGFADVAVLQAAHMTADLPLLQAASITGLHDSGAASRDALARLQPALQATLARPFESELLALLPSGSSYLFCTQPLDSLAALRGRRVRHWHEAQAGLLLALGASPLPAPLEQPAPGPTEEPADCSIAHLRAALGSGLAGRAPYLYGLRLQVDVAAWVARRERLQREPLPAQRLREAALARAEAEWQQTEAQEAALLGCLRERKGCEPFGAPPAPPVRWQPPAAGDAERLRGHGREALRAWLDACEQALEGCAARVRAALDP